MNKDTILKRMTEVFRDVLDNDSLVLERDTTADDVEEWDSLSHINLIGAIEHEFNVKFDLVDIKPLKNIGEFTDLIQKKIS